MWELMKPSWCPSPNANSIMRATQDVQRELNSDCNLRDLNIIYILMMTASESNGEDKVELPGWGPEDWVAVYRKSVDWRVTSVEVWIAWRPWRNHTSN